MSKKRLLAVLLGAVALAAGASGAGEAREVREVGGFERVSFHTRGHLLLRQDGQEALEIEAPAGELARLVTEVRDGTLFIGRREGGAPPLFGEPVFRLSLKRLSGLETHSSGRITAQSLRADALSVLLSSSGGVTLGWLEADSLEVRISSSGSLRAAGRVQRQEVRLSSSGGYSAGELDSGTASVRVSSSGSATVRVSGSLQADITSSGSVRYYGDPPEVRANVTSSGGLVRLGD